jgi:nucleoside-diphosphate-sugar epimerase
MKGMIIGITGATGNLGQSLIAWLLENKYSVKSLVRNPDKEDELLAKTIIVKGDICEYVSLKEFIKGLDICIHLAAFVGIGSWATYKYVNIKGTENICRAIKAYNPDCQLIYTSTVSAYELSYRNWLLSTRYARSKYYAEKIVDKYIKREKLKATIIYPGYIYGPKDTKFLPAIISFLKTGKAFLATGGERNAPLIYISDLCKMIELIIKTPKAIGKKYLAISDQEIGMHDIFNMVADQLGLIRPNKKRSKYMLYILAIICELYSELFHTKTKLTRRQVHALSMNFSHKPDKAKGELGWQAEVDISFGINQAILWLREQQHIS